ncbi:hypothetical protein HDU96_005807 [Phlyctochytrium bullatum]|nr:hypothetical protein HDU96_005807 [Phlyctochytrium bullatum]
MQQPYSAQSPPMSQAPHHPQAQQYPSNQQPYGAHSQQPQRIPSPAPPQQQQGAFFPRPAHPQQHGSGYPTPPSQSPTPPHQPSPFRPSSPYVPAPPPGHLPPVPNGYPQQQQHQRIPSPQPPYPHPPYPQQPPYPSQQNQPPHPAFPPVPNRYPAPQQFGAQGRPMATPPPRNDSSLHRPAHHPPPAQPSHLHPQHPVGGRPYPGRPADAVSVSSSVTSGNDGRMDTPVQMIQQYNQHPTQPPTLEKQGGSVGVVGSLGPVGSRKTFWQRLIPQEEKDSKVFWSKTMLYSMLVVNFILFILQSVVIHRLTTTYYDIKAQIDSSRDYWDDDELSAASSNLTATICYSSSFYLAILFATFLTWDAILQQNLVQVVALVAYNFGMFVFTIIQLSQSAILNEDINNNGVDTGSRDANLRVLRIVQIFLILITLVWFLACAFFAYRLFNEFTWRIYRRIGGDIKLEREFQQYHIYLLCIKYSIFFLTIFILQVSVLVDGRQYLRLVAGTVVVAIPLGLAMLLFAYYGVRREDRRMLAGAFLSALIFLIYVGVRLFLLYDKNKDEEYKRARPPATFFGVMGMLLLVGAGVFTWVCVGAFGTGLKALLAQNRKNAPPLPELNLDE